MTHNATVVKTKQLSNGGISITHRCCNDATSDRPATLYVNASTSQNDVASWELKERQKAQDLHAAAQNAKSLLDSLVPVVAKSGILTR
jgi:hypothetical protein